MFNSFIVKAIHLVDSCSNRWDSYLDERISNISNMLLDVE